MMRTPLALSIPLVLVLGGCNGLGKVDLLRLATSGRDGYQHPERVISSLGLRPGQRVADIGAGDGYFVPWLSEAVGPEGRVYAVEVDDEKVAVLRALVERRGLANVEVVRGEFEDPRLPDGAIDLAFSCRTYHHIDDRPAYFARLRIDLTADGRVAHIDDRDDLGGILGMFLTEGHWSNVEQMSAEMAAGGYRRVASFDFLPTQSFEIFAPGPPSAEAGNAPSRLPAAGP